MSQQSIRRWQLAFLAGVAFVLATAAFAFGISRVTAVIALLAAILSVANGLIAPTSQAAPKENLLLAKSKQILNVSFYLKVLTVLVWISTLTMAISAGVAAYNETRLLDIGGIVQTAEGERADTAIVSLNTLPEPTTTIASNGEFTFAPIDPVAFGSSPATLMASWKDKTASVQLNLESHLGNMLIELPPGELPLRVMFRELLLEDVQALIEGRVSSDLARKLDGQPFIIPSGPFLMARELFSEPTHNPPSKLSDLSLSKVRQLHGADGWLLFGGDHGVMFAKPVGEKASSQMLRGRIASILLHQIPTDFGIYEVSYSACSGEDDPMADLTLKFRQPLLRVVVIENSLPEPVRVGTFLLRESPSAGYERRSSHAKRHETISPTARRLFPLGILQPKEKILLPLELVFSFMHRRDALENLVANTTSFQNKVRSSSALEYSVSLGGLTIELERRAILEMLEPSKGYLFEDYVYGPSLSLAGLSVNNVTYPLRTPNPDQYVILWGDDLPATSCPFVYTFDHTAEAWRKEGHILFGLVGKANERLDLRPLARFDGRIMLREEEPEVSFIDLVYIQVTSPDGRQHILTARNDLLRSADGRYLRLSQGEELEIRFDGLQVEEGSRYVVAARGYYEPFVR